jgi:hypothetical protein
MGSLTPELSRQLDALTREYGDLRAPTDDGRNITFAELRAELEAQSEEAERFGQLFDIAAACAARNGF